MHRIEIGNENAIHVFILESATRQELKISLKGLIETVRVEDYVSFATDLTKAYHRLDGEATLKNSEGDAVLSLTFHRGRVEVDITFGKQSKTFQTDQSYITTTVRQIGIVE